MYENVIQISKINRIQSLLEKQVVVSLSNITVHRLICGVLLCFF